MRAAIVKASTLSQHRRWDAGYYLGQIDGLAEDQAVQLAEVRLLMAKERLETVRAKREQARQRRQGLIDRGEIVPIE